MDSYSGDQRRLQGDCSLGTGHQKPSGILIAVGGRAPPLLGQREGKSGLGREDPLEEESILAWRIPWTEEPGGLQSMGSQRVRHDLVTEHTCTLLT